MVCRTVSSCATLCRFVPLYVAMCVISDDVSWWFVLCHTMVCCVLVWNAFPCCVVLCCAALSRAMPFIAASCRAALYCVVLIRYFLCFDALCRAVSWCAVPWRLMPWRLVPCCVVQSCAVLCCKIPCCDVFRREVSYRLCMCYIILYSVGRSSLGFMIFCVMCDAVLLDRFAAP